MWARTPKFFQFRCKKFLYETDRCGKYDWLFTPPGLGNRREGTGALRRPQYVGAVVITSSPGICEADSLGLASQKPHSQVRLKPADSATDGSAFQTESLCTPRNIARLYNVRKQGKIHYLFDFRTHNLTTL
jgi:hypothetical protein